MTVFGVDPHYAKPYAVTVLRDGKIEYQSKMDLRSIYDLAVGLKPDAIAIEDQYLSRNYKVAKGLSWSAGKVQGVAELLGILCVTVNVASWKARFKVSKGKGSHLPVSVALGGADDDDLASSHLIALHAWQQWTG